MGLSIVKSFSILVASGNGQKCSAMKGALRNGLITMDEQTGLSKIHLHKNCKKDPIYKEDSLRVSREVYCMVKELLEGIPEHFFGSDVKINRAELN